MSLTILLKCTSESQKVKKRSELPLVANLSAVLLQTGSPVKKYLIRQNQSPWALRLSSAEAAFLLSFFFRN